MRLFDETESKYYELISYLLLQKRSFTDKEVDLLLSELSHGEKDYQILETLFPKKKGQEVLFTYEEGNYSSFIEDGISIRCNGIEKQAFRSLCRLPYADRILGNEILQKIKSFVKDENDSLVIEKIEAKNRHDAFNNKTSNNEVAEDEERKLLVIADAIRQKRSIIYDNSREGAYDFRKVEAFPVKIEYSVLQDIFRISAFNPKQDRFFLMTLETMRQVCLGTNKRNDVPDLYKDFLQKKKRKVLLDVEPTGHVIERCFRIFSFYERKAVYDRESDKYSLEITYNAYDEAELIRDILSLGSSAVVMEPMRLRKIVYDRIIAASKVFA